MIITSISLRDAHPPIFYLKVQGIGPRNVDWTINKIVPYTFTQLKLIFQKI